MPHESSLMKALYMHLQTRQWILKPRGLRYYAIAPEVSDADRAALRTVARLDLYSCGSRPEGRWFKSTRPTTSFWSSNLRHKRRSTSTWRKTQEAQNQALRNRPLLYSTTLSLR